MKPVDQAARDAAIGERARNVIIDAGAGTGKTTTLVRRLVEMVAPADGARAIPIERIAAVTFTRRASGELRLRIRAELLERLADPALEPPRRELLHAALGGLDVAAIGTIHSFADRLLRMRPVDARLSPAYEIHEDPDALVHETYRLLLHGAEYGTLASEIGAELPPELVVEAATAVRDAIRARLLTETQEINEFYSRYGLDVLVAGMIAQRDVLLAVTAPAELDLEAYHRAMREFVESARPVLNDSNFGHWLARIVERMEHLEHETDPVVLFAELAVEISMRRKNAPQKARDCAGDKALWSFWKALDEGGKHRGGASPLGDELTAPLYSWLATRLARISPVVLALYDKVKARHRAVDQLDLLLQLRNLVQRNLEARAHYQGLFDHIFVDEFQDTDPLQAEVLLYLCEKQPKADSWREIELAAGKLTIVGDPKQSIYRFRRADVSMYDTVRRKVAAANALEVELAANFRSVSSLITWANARFASLLGTDDVRRFDPEIGRVFHRDLAVGRTDDRTPAVHVIPFELDDETADNADNYRALEAEVTAQYIQWLVEKSGLRIRDPHDRVMREVRHGDVAVLAISTYFLPHLFRELDARDIPYASAGGRLFLGDPLHRQFLLGLRALADRDDGVATAALLRPPFFALDLEDLFVSRAEGADAAHPTVARVQAAREQIRELRRRRFERGVGHTARDLLEQSGFARHVALGPNGAQRLERLRELCHLLDIRAAERGLDFDAVTAELRAWVDDPEQIDAPRPVGAEAVQVLTVHQAKGLEFPVVIWWDGKASVEGIRNKPPWSVSRDGDAWSIALYGLEASSRPGIDLAATEKRYRDEERRRVTYVACTRARELLALPRAGDPGPNLLCGHLIAEDPPGAIALDVYRQGQGAAWCRDLKAPVRASPAIDGGVEAAALSRWSAGRAAALRTLARPIAVSAEAHAREDTHEGETPPKSRAGRFGPEFGTLVHQALGEVVQRGLDVDGVVRDLARRTGQGDRIEEATADVRRALEALRAAGLLGPEVTVRVEYPVAGPAADGVLLIGSADFVAATAERTCVVDFKTDAPPRGAVATDYPAYVAQVHTYARLLSPVAREVRPALLFTADGGLHWV